MSNLTDLEIKRCCCCLKDKNVNLFHKDKSKADGKYPACKECKNKGQIKSYRKNIQHVKKYKEKNKEKIAEYHKHYQSEYYDKNKERILDRCKEHQKTEKGKITAAKAYKKWFDENPKKAKARNVVFAAIKAGQLVRMPCEECGCIETHGHHVDYNNALDVMWLCPKHHKAWHKTNGEGKNG